MMDTTDLMGQYKPPTKSDGQTTTLSDLTKQTTGSMGPTATTQGGTTYDYDDPSNTSAPSWMGGNAYSKWWQGSDPDYDPNDPAVKQRWWRSPQVGGGIVWHPYWGWQDRSKVKDLYKQDADNNVTWDEFQNWGLTQQLGEDWSQYFPDATVDSGGGGGDVWSQILNLAGGGTGGAMPTMPTMPQGNMPGGTGGIDTSQLGAFNNYPPEWDTAGNTYNYFATGGATDVPWQWDEASRGAYDMLGTGNPTSASPWYQQAKQQTQYDIEDAIKQANEQAGLGGQRWSSVLGRTAQDISSRRMAELGSQYAQMEMGAEEAARNRQLQSMGMLQGLGGDYAGLTESAKNRAMGAAQGLQGLGQQYFNAPMDLASQSFQMGSGLQNAQQQMIDKYFGEFMRNAGENNPYLNMIYQMATGQGVPQQYTPGLGSQLLGGLTGLGSSYLLGGKK